MEQRAAGAVAAPGHTAAGPRRSPERPGGTPAAPAPPATPS